MYIKKFIEKVSLIESKTNKDLVMSISDARFLRDEIAKLLVDYNELLQKPIKEPVLKIELKGRSFNE